MGITRIANVTGLDHIGIPVVMVCRPNSRALAVAQGKGTTLDAAKASGVMESIETYHAERVHRPLLYGSLHDLEADHRLVDVTRLNQPRDSAFHPDLPLLWVEGFDLIAQHHVWVPFEMVHANFTTPRPSGSGCFAQTSNGLASGNHLLEAVTHCLTEVVERDAATLWSLRGEAYQRSTRVDLDTVTDPECRRVLDLLEQAGMAVAAWELTSDVGIPVYMSMFCDRANASIGLVENYRGYGCHSTHEIALLRALTEAAQMRLTIISGSRDDLDPAHYRGRAAKGAPRQSVEWLDHDGTLRTFGDGDRQDFATFDEEIDWQLRRLEAAGIESAVVVDLTRPEFGLPVARLVVPGLEMAFMEWNYFATGERARHAQRTRGAQPTGVSA
ncbi:ribosomal protein S12 methylthiotransferase accessory factor [Actinopolymorpha rutila]|uniref:Ribosomal protein S12 methylthiotransferase accessory factor n=2 Tax=Actinopolymorpha rutila TaxID=446787 RepID=A0A852ZAD2_9ACTN|nr:ribosomal protein S12 methylthiotransferase accessory factor [Actinopolymorpha rutila]